MEAEIRKINKYRLLSDAKILREGGEINEFGRIFLSQSQKNKILYEMQSEMEARKFVNLVDCLINQPVTAREAIRDEWGFTSSGQNQWDEEFFKSKSILEGFWEDCNLFNQKSWHYDYQWSEALSKVAGMILDSLLVAEKGKIFYDRYNPSSNKRLIMIFEKTLAICKENEMDYLGEINKGESESA